MKLEMTNCYFCTREIPIGAAICPYCGKNQSNRPTGAFQLRVVLAVALAVVVLSGRG